MWPPLRTSIWNPARPIRPSAEPHYAIFSFALALFRLELLALLEEHALTLEALSADLSPVILDETCGPVYEAVAKMELDTLFLTALNDYDPEQLSTEFQLLIQAAKMAKHHHAAQVPGKIRRLHLELPDKIIFEFIPDAPPLGESPCPA